MSDLRGKIQLARIQDDAWLWEKLIQQLLEEDRTEGLKAALSGATRGVPGGEVKTVAIKLIVAQLEPMAKIDLKIAMDAATTAAIYSKPDSEERATATAFMVAHLEALAAIDSALASTNSQFALGWARPGSEIEHEAARIWNRLNVAHPGADEAPYRESDVLGQNLEEQKSRSVG